MGNVSLRPLLLLGIPEFQQYAPQFCSSFCFSQDIALLTRMGLRSYRFSIAWTRIIPDGMGAVNQAGIDHYNALLDALAKAGITPFVTLFHWDTPLELETRLGGWLNADMEQYFC
jgi:beta-glucosidase/6-phospho-beta-glucosidase/beta-galactosidase